MRYDNGSVAGRREKLGVPRTFLFWICQYVRGLFVISSHCCVMFAHVLHAYLAKKHAPGAIVLFVMFILLMFHVGNGGILVYRGDYVAQILMATLHSDIHWCMQM